MWLSWLLQKFFFSGIASWKNEVTRKGLFYLKFCMILNKIFIWKYYKFEEERSQDFFSNFSLYKKKTQANSIWKTIEKENGNFEIENCKFEIISSISKENCWLFLKWHCTTYHKNLTLHKVKKEIAHTMKNST